MWINSWERKAREFTTKFQAWAEIFGTKLKLKPGSTQERWTSATVNETTRFSIHQIPTSYR